MPASRPPPPPPRPSPAGIFLSRLRAYAAAVNAAALAGFLYHWLHHRARNLPVLHTGGGGSGFLLPLGPAPSDPGSEGVAVRAARAADERLRAAVRALPAAQARPLAALVLLGGAPGAHAVLRLVWRRRVWTTPAGPSTTTAVSKSGGGGSSGSAAAAAVQFEERHRWERTTAVLARQQTLLLAAAHVWAALCLRGGLLGRSAEPLLGGKAASATGWALLAWAVALVAWGEGKMEG